MLLVFAGLFLAACGPDGPVSPGKRIYLANCAICHTVDPARGGPRGPALAGASPTLLERKLLAVTYPRGYKPRRPTSMMPRFPNIAPFIPELAEYLNRRDRSG